MSVYWPGAATSDSVMLSVSWARMPPARRAWLCVKSISLEHRHQLADVIDDVA
jgi:hypothetical protein